MKRLLRWLRGRKDKGATVAVEAHDARIVMGRPLISGKYPERYREGNVPLDTDTEAP